jgi:hypothetical protein
VRAFLKRHCLIAYFECSIARHPVFVATIHCTMFRRPGGRGDYASARCTPPLE